MNGEHTPLDAPTTNTIFAELTREIGEDVSRSLSMKRAAAAPDTSELVELGVPQSLYWHLTPELRRAIEAATRECQTLSDDVAITLAQFGAFGRDQLKARRVSPDTFVQLAMQLAYALTHDGATVATYETAQTRQFLHGRTECVRSASTASQRWCRAALDVGVARLDKQRALAAAFDAHNAQMNDCTNGQGIDRHMLGLKLQALETGDAPPAFTTHATFAKSNSFMLSTSQVHFPSYTGGFAAVTPDGYGVCYSCQPNWLRFSITAWRSSKLASVAVEQNQKKKKLRGKVSHRSIYTCTAIQIESRTSIAHDV